MLPHFFESAYHGIMLNVFPRLPQPIFWGGGGAGAYIRGGGVYLEVVLCLKFSVLIFGGGGGGGVPSGELTYGGLRYSYNFRMKIILISLVISDLKVKENKILLFRFLMS